jgi:hypothetical protein
MRVLLVLALCSSCAARPTVGASYLINGNNSQNVAGDVTTCEPYGCGGGTADPLEIGVGLALVVGLLVARALYSAD